MKNILSVPRTILNTIILVYLALKLDARTLQKQDNTVGNAPGNQGSLKPSAIPKPPTLLPERKKTIAENQPPEKDPNSELTELSNFFRQPTYTPPPRRHAHTYRPPQPRHEVTVEKIPAIEVEKREAKVYQQCYAWCRLPEEASDSQEPFMSFEEVDKLTKSQQSFIQVRKALPTLREVTITCWLHLPYYGVFVNQIKGQAKGTIFSYFVETAPELEIVVDGITFIITVHGKQEKVTLPVAEDLALHKLISSWLHFSLSYSSIDGSVCFHVNGQPLLETTLDISDLSSSIQPENFPTISEGGIFVVGQKVGAIFPDGLKFEPGLGLVGCIYDFNVYSIKLSEKDIGQMYHGCERSCGDLISWSQQHVFDAIGVDIVTWPFQHRCCTANQQGLNIKGSLSS